MPKKKARSYKFSETTIRLLGELAKTMPYRSATNVIETLVWREGKARDLLRPANGEPPKRRKLSKEQMM